LYVKELPEANDERIRFHCRLQGAVYAYYRKRPRGISRAVRRALARFRLVMGGGMFKIGKISRFLARADVEDKIELCIRLTVADKDLIEKYAFALRLSQAEVLRIVLEWFMEAISVHAPQFVFYAARRKWHHRRPNPKPITMRFSSWQPGRLLELQIPDQDAITAACAAIRDIWPDRFIRGR